VGGIYTVTVRFECDSRGVERARRRA
jgi:hypothetical protein